MPNLRVVSSGVSNLRSSTDKPQVIVVGGGIAGLSCAWRLMSYGLDVRLFEAKEKAGGNVRTDRIDGFSIERGPHTFRAAADAVFDLAREVGVESELVVSRPSARARFVARRGRLYSMPTGVWTFLTSGLLSFGSKITLMTEPFRTRDRGDPSDSAAQFFTRRFGSEAAQVLAGAFISGVYAGDPNALSAAAAFPLFWSFEQNRGSMILGALSHMRRQKKRRKSDPERFPKRFPGLYSFKRGLGELSTAVAAKLGERCLTDTSVISVKHHERGFEVATTKGVFQSSQVAVATPPNEAASVLKTIDPNLADDLAGIPMAPMTVIQLGFEDRIEQIPDGFGYLAPREEGLRSLGVLFPSRLFDGRNPDGGDLLCGYVGGALDPDSLVLDDTTLFAIVESDLRRLVGLSTKPSMIRIRRNARAIPQFVQGHLSRMARIREGLANYSGLQLAGNYLKGVGMKDAVESGFEAAEAIRAYQEKLGKL